MRKKLNSSILSLLIIMLYATASVDAQGVFESKNAIGYWHISTDWTLVSGSDADGIPDADDNITILTGNVLWITSDSQVNDVIIQTGATLNHDPNDHLIIYGNYLNNGIEKDGNNSAYTSFAGAGKTIDGTGEMSSNGGYRFDAAVTILSSANLTVTDEDVDINVDGVSIATGGQFTLFDMCTMTINGAITFTNNGTVVIPANCTVDGSVALSTWTNGASGSLKLETNDFMTTGKMNLSAVGSTVEYDGGNQTVFETNYYNLVLSGTGTKTTGADITCQNLTIATGVTFIDVPPGKKVICTGNLDIDGTLSVNGDIILSGAGATIDGTGTVTSTSKYEFINGKTVLASANITFSGTATHIDIKDPLTNNGTVTTSLWLKGSGTWTQGPNAVLNYTNTTNIQPPLNASASGNKVNYGATGNQNVKIPADGSYFHLTSSGTGSKYLQANTDINGDLSILDAAQFDPSDYDITVAGNWINISTHADAFIQDNELVTFDGAVAQSITCSSGEEIYYDVIINNTGNTITLLDNIKINNQLDWTTSGYLDVNGNILTIENWNDGDIPTLGTDRYIIIDSAGTFTINGVGAGETANFPMGFSTFSTDFCRLDVENNDGGNTSFSVSPFNYVNYEGTSSGGNQITSGGVNITWDITSTSTNANLTFYWDTSQELPGFNPSSCVVAHKASGMNWEDDISPWTSASNLSGNIYYRTENADGFGPFGVFSGGAALPIELTSFNAIIENKTIKLIWTTLTEINNAFFTIEKSTDLENWIEVDVISGAGNSNAPLDYSTVDENPYPGSSYYRLKQTDYNGEFTYSIIVPVKYEVNTIGTMNLFPSPLSAGETLNVEFKNIFNSELLVMLRDIQGRAFYSKMIINIEDGKLIGVPIDMEIPAGIYLITATSENQVYSQKLIVK